MSNSYIDKILLNPKKYNPYSRMKPAVKDSSFYFTNCISFNIVENLSQFKNKELSQATLNLRMLGNLSFLFAKNKLRTKKNKLKEKIKSNTKKDNNLNNKKNNKNTIKNTEKNEEDNFKIIEGYECYIPTKRIPYFNKRPVNEKTIIKKESSKSNHKILKKNHKEIKIPLNLKNINFFRPTGRFLIMHTNNANNSNLSSNKIKKIGSLNNSNTSDGYSEGLSNSLTYTNTNIEDNNVENISSEDYSLICGEVDDNIFHEKSFMDILKTSTTFPKYSELTDLIECPLDDVYPPEMKYKNYLYIFNEFLNEEYYDDNSNNKINDNENNNLNNITINSNTENSIINLSEDTNDDFMNNDINNNKRIFIINPTNYKPCTNNSDKNKGQMISAKSGKLIKINTNIFSNYNSSTNKTSVTDDDDEEVDEYKKDESLFAFFENNKNKKKSPSKNINSKIKKILPKSAVKYANKMSNKYILLMYERYKIISEKLKVAKNLLNDENMLKKFLLQLLKNFILNIGISTKKFYEKLIKYEIHNREGYNFERYMSIFDLILMDNNKENLRFKFLFLLKIISSNDDNDQILDEKKMNIFFDLIGCEMVYINRFCELLGERLPLRYKAIYNNVKLDKNIDNNFIYRKIKIIIESFLDILDS